ncbi:hypothetical protein [Anaerotignum propionicum]|uniref:Uncharacterized protein n=2 Tax=Anaerotignum propionicum DSM 1682 TaxID=991789 RepID=A0ABN4LDP9_ANAPI|nr:hypothetical protein [Anaerotignum propionicum]AMJ41688.1 hypothetical protein CPRO_21080 [Anaerotignum propionicum DSM 1682]
MIDLGSLVAKVVVDSGDGTKKLQDFSTQAENTDGKMKTFANNVSGGVKTAVLGITAAVSASAVALYGMATKSAEATDRIDKMSQKIGISREAFQEMDFVCSQSGMSVEQLQVGMKTLTSAMDGVASGNKNNIEQFQKLGVAVTNADGSLRKQEDVMFDAMSALQSMENQTEKARLATELFGKSGSEMMPMLNGAAGSIEEMRQKAHDLGLVMGDDAIDSGVAFTDMVDQIKRSFGAVTTQVGVEVMPILMELGQFILDNMPTIQEVVSTAFTVIQEVVSVAGQLIGGLIDVIKALVKNAQTEGAFFNAVWEQIKIFIDTTFRGIQALFSAFTALFNGDWEGFWNGVKEFLSILLDGLIQLITNSAKFFLNAGKSIFTSLWDGLKSVWENIKKWVQDTVDWLTDKLTFWRKSKSEMSEDDDDSDGSHRNGLSYVPFDGYKSILHKGEMVLTQAEADRYRNGENGGSKTENFIVNIEKVENSNGRTTGDLMREMEFYRKSKKLATGGV